MCSKTFHNEPCGKSSNPAPGGQKSQWHVALYHEKELRVLSSLRDSLLFPLFFIDWCSIFGVEGKLCEMAVLGREASPGRWNLGSALPVISKVASFLCHPFAILRTKTFFPRDTEGKKRELGQGSRTLKSEQDVTVRYIRDTPTICGAYKRLLMFVYLVMVIETYAWERKYSLQNSRDPFYFLLRKYNDLIENKSL